MVLIRVVLERAQIMASFEGFKDGGRKTLRIIGTVRPVFPLVMLGVGAFIPVLQVPVAMPTTNGLWLALAITAGFMAVWIGAEVYTVVDRKTGVTHLQWDDFISLVMAVTLTEWHGRLVAANELQWWFVLPWVGVLVDAVLSGTLAINNAAQKPLIEQPK